MIKKFLILPLIWGLMSITAFASANTVDWFTSDSEIINCSSDITVENNNVLFSSVSYEYKMCLNISPTNSLISQWEEGYEGDNAYVSTINSNVFCLDVWDTDSAEISFNNNISSLKGYCSESAITYSSSSDNDSSSSAFPSIPASFTSWITTLVNNFGWTMVAWLPTIILVSMWIVAIFALFRVVRRYAKKSFRW